MARNQLIGVMIGFLGAFSLVVTRTEARPLAFNTAGLLVIVATILYGINSNWIKKYLTGYPPLEVASLSLFIISPAALGGLWLTGVFPALQTQAGAGVAAAYLILLGIFSTGLATVLFYQLIQMTSAVFASSVTYLIPLVALMWGTLDGESIGLAQLAGMGIILLGVWLINQRKAVGNKAWAAFGFIPQNMLPRLRKMLFILLSQLPRYCPGWLPNKGISDGLLPPLAGLLPD
ncbi:MAG: DMT family transporter [Microscillaceae bacterium]|nr:DMT family transporter [Microscillaceae bacterium]